MVDWKARSNSEEFKQDKKSEPEVSEYLFSAQSITIISPFSNPIGQIIDYLHLDKSSEPKAL